MAQAAVDEHQDCPLVGTPVVASQEDTDGTIAPGTRVVIHNLLSKPELNGAVGTIAATGRDSASGRYAVEFSDGSRLALKAANLDIVPPPASAAPGTSAVPISPMWRPKTDEDIKSVWWLLQASSPMVSLDFCCGSLSSTALRLMSLWSDG